MFNQYNNDSDPQSLRYRRSPKMAVVGIWVLGAAILLCSAVTAHSVDLADAPMFAKMNPPATNLMILQDDSGSMGFSVLVKGRYDGRFPNPDEDRPEIDGFRFIFDEMGDTEGEDDHRFFGKEGRLYWQSQFHETNIVFYNPRLDYQPWPGYGAITFADADMDNPRINPVRHAGDTLNLDEESLNVGGNSIPWAHYFVRSEDNGTVYLVIMDGTAKANKYYTFEKDSGTEPNDKITSITEEPTPPDDIVRPYDDDRQNFANWFKYHRRREFIAKAAIARTLNQMEDVRVGILGINEQVVVPLKPVKAVIGGVFKDEVDAIIGALYEYESGGGTPLKQGLEKVGEYYRVNDGNLEGQKGDPPYPADGGACQQSFTIVVTDGYYSDPEHKSVGNADGSKDNETWGGSKVPFMDAYKDTLADLAMHYYATDLSSMEDKVPTNKWDGAPHQHMVTFAVAFGVSGTLDPGEYEDDRTSEDYMKSKKTGDYVEWPAVPGSREQESIDDLWHATVNGRGVFVNAGQPEKLVEGLLQIIKDIKSRQPTSAASVAVNGDSLFAKIGPDVVLFQGSYSYIDDEWGGDVRAYTLDPKSGEVNTDAPKWSAAEQLQNTAWSTRTILTFDGDKSGLPFTYDELTDAQKIKLDSEETANYIRGKDPGGSGNRSKMLKDVVHSAPVFMDNVVYFGANDGMLHAVDASDGTELFAYVPNLVFDHLKELADPAYDHLFYVDLTPTVKRGEKLLSGLGFQTILVGGLGKGGMGYFALDITNPLVMSKAQVLWEFPRKDTSAEDVADMGYSYSKPVVVRSYSTAHPWIVIAGNGYNSANGASALFILNAKTGDVIKNIPAGSGPDNGLSSPIAVDVDFDDIVDFVFAGDLKGNLWKFDLTSTKFSEWEVAYKEGATGVPLFTALDPDGNPQPITAKPDVMLHPVEHGLVVCFGTGKFLGSSDFSDLSQQTIYGIWDYGDRSFLPGKGWSEDDSQEYLGTFRDPKEAVTLSNQPAEVELLRQEATDLSVDFGGGNIVTLRALTDNQPVWVTEADTDLPQPQFPDPTDNRMNNAGWYLDLPAKERVISDVILRGGILIAIGFTPNEDRCGPGGDSMFMELNAFSGGQLASIQFDVNDDGEFDQDDLVEIDTDVLVPPSGMKLPGSIQPPAIIGLDEEKEKKYLSSSSGGIVEVTEKAAKTGISYWMEIRE